MQRALEKTKRELASLRGALESAEGEDFPSAEYDEADAQLDVVTAFTGAEGRRLQQKILAAGGLEPGRVRRTGAG